MWHCSQACERMASACTPNACELACSENSAKLAACARGLNSDATKSCSCDKPESFCAMEGLSFCCGCVYKICCKFRTPIWAVH